MRSLHDRSIPPSRAVLFLPLAIFVGIAALLALYWWGVERQERSSIRLKTELTAEQVALRLEQFVADRLNVVEHAADVWATAGPPTEEDFRLHVESLSRSFSGVVAINWVDADGVIRWVVPEDANRAARGRDLSTKAGAGPVVAAARDSRTLRVTPPLELYQGGIGFAAYAPVVTDDGVVGFVNVAFRIKAMFDGVLGPSVRDRFHVEIADGGRTVYRNEAEGHDRGAAYRRSRTVRIGDRTWTLSMWPGDAQVHVERSSVDESVVVVGMLIAIGLSYATWRIARSRAEIAAGERRYREVVEDSPALICRSSPDGMLTFVNAAYARYFGVAARRLVGTSFFDLVPEEDHDLLRRNLEPLSREHPTQRHEHRVLRADGSVGWIEWNNRGYFDARGELIELQSYGVDRTDSHRTRRELEVSEARFREIFNAVSDGILVLDEAGTVLDVNRSGCEAFGLDRDGLVGRGIGSFEDPDALAEPSLPALIDRMSVPGAGAAARERDLLRPSGAWRADIELRRVVLGDENRVLAVVRDVTERSYLEEQLRQSQKMEAMGTLAAGIAHDFNNVLTAILGHAELAREHLPEDSPASRSVQGIAAACDQASGVTRSLLAMGRQVRTRRSPMDVTSTVRHTLQMLRPLLRDAIEVRREIPETESLWIEGDSAQIQQILINLVLNARDAIRGAGTITVALRAEGAADGEDDDRVVLQISDDGAGMSEEVRRRVLEPFFTTKPRERGTGLGMSVVHGIVLAHDGSLSIDSRPGHGTSVTVRFPRCPPSVDESRADEAPVPPPAGPSSGGRILVVEDNDQVRRLLLDSLTAAGFVVDSAADGVDGLAAWNAGGRGMDLLIVDLDLPRMGGEELVRRIREQGASVPVILVSGNPEVGHRLEDDPAITFLEKPFRLSRVVEQVTRTLAGRA